MRRVMLAVLLLWGSQALAEPLNYEAMREACRDPTRAESYTVCEAAIDLARKQHKIFKNAGADWVRDGRRDVGEAEMRRTMQSNVLGVLHNDIFKKFPKVWELRQAPRKPAEAKP